MKKVLLGTTALLMSAGVAAADVAVSGDGRMGIIDDFAGSFDTEDGFLTGFSEEDNSGLGFTSRIRIAFSASGETDAGLAFGGSVRVDNYERDQATNGTEGSVFIEGGFGKITMGDTSGAAEAAVGDLSGVGLTGLGDYNELTYLANSIRPAARWDFVSGGFGIHVSSDNPENDSSAADDDASIQSVAVTFSAGALSAGLGYETASTDDTDADHVVGSVAYGFGDATIKGAYGTATADDGTAEADFEQIGLSLDYVVGATTATAYYMMKEVDPDGGDTVEQDAFGIGFAYDLGGGASIVGGYASVDGANDESADAFDLGISMSF